MRTPRDWGVILIAIAAAVGPGCARPQALLAPEPGVTFAAHHAGDRVTLDRLPSGARGALESPAWPHLPDEPSFVLRAGSETRAALWIVGHSRVLVRRDADTTSPRVAEVLSAWDAGALRLTLFQEDGPTLAVDRFAREQGADPAPLSRAAPLGGTYRAATRDAQGAAVGWLRVRVEPPLAPVYDGVLPDTIGDALAAAVALALDGEVAWIEEHPSR